MALVEELTRWSGDPRGRKDVAGGGRARAKASGSLRGRAGGAEPVPVARLLGV